MGVGVSARLDVSKCSKVRVWEMRDLPLCIDVRTGGWRH